MKPDFLYHRRSEGSKENGIWCILKKLEHYLLGGFLISFIILIIAQGVLLKPLSRQPVHEKEFFQGEPLLREAYLYKHCKMELKLKNIDTCPELKVLVNGDEYTEFSNKTILLNLKSGDVVELDASNVLVLATIQISGVSENISRYLGKTFDISDGITFIAKV